MTNQTISKLAMTIETDARLIDELGGRVDDIQIVYPTEYGEIEGNPRQGVSIETKDGYCLIFDRVNDGGNVLWWGGHLIDEDDIHTVPEAITTYEMVSLCETFKIDDEIELTDPNGEKFKVHALLVDINSSEDGRVIINRRGRCSEMAMKETHEELFDIAHLKIEELREKSTALMEAAK